jgi:phospholipid/cholesterol/gamma-HCH transport system ATP-binding protein
MIRVSGLSRAFDGKKVLEDVSLDVARGELVVILGESGTGKSVLLKHLVGLLKPDSGAIEVDGQDITRLTERDLLDVRRQIGYLFQEGALYDFMTVFDNVAFPLREHTRLKEAEIRDKVRTMLDTVDLRDADSKFPAELSGGMRKRVGLARAIVLDSKILLCDEPTSGLDPIRSRDISDLIRQVAKQMHCTTVITSHDIDNSLRIGDRLALMKDGRIVALGTSDELRASSHPFVREFIKVQAGGI